MVGTVPEWPIVVADCECPLCPGVGDGGRTASTCCEPLKSAEPPCSQFAACQCSVFSNDMAWDRLGTWRTIRATLFCTHCNFRNPDGVGWSTVDHSVALIDAGQDQTARQCLCKVCRQQVSNETDGLCVEVA